MFTLDARDGAAGAVPRGLSAEPETPRPGAPAHPGGAPLLDLGASPPPPRRLRVRVEGDDEGGGDADPFVLEGEGDADPAGAAAAAGSPCRALDAADVCAAHSAAADGDCVWCVAKAVPSACFSRADAARLPPAVFVCDA